MRRVKQDELIPIQDLFAKASKDIDKNHHYKVMELWDELDLPIPIKSRTFAHRLSNDSKLFIGVKAACLANDLQFMKESLVQKINQRIQNVNEELIAKENYQQAYLKPIKTIIFELRA